MGVSNVYFRTGNYELSLDNGIKAAQIYDQLKDTTNYIKSMELQAQVYQGLKKFNESLIIYKDLLLLSSKIRDSINIVYNTEHIGGVYAFMNDYDSALFYIKKALELNQNLKKSALPCNHLWKSWRDKYDKRRLCSGLEKS